MTYTFLGNTSVAEPLLYIKEFIFDNALGIDVFDEMSFSDTTKIRLHPVNRMVCLKKQSDGYFPTDEDIWFATWITNPLSLRQIKMLQVFGRTPTDTYSQVRITDGTDHYFWDAVGGAWSVAGDGDWNDEGTFNAHIETFEILPERKFGIVVNLKTDDKYVSPFVREIRVLMEIHICYMEDLIYRSLIPFIKENVKPLANYSLPKVLEDTTEINLNEYTLDTAFNIVDVVSVYDWTDDVDLLYNLLDTYDLEDNIITLTAAIPEDHIPFIIFKYQPEVVYTTQQDYVEVAKIPAVVIERLEVPIAEAYNLLSSEGVVDKGTGRAFVVHEPWRATLQFRIHAITDRGVDELRLMEAVMKFFDENRMLRSIGLDEYYAIQIVREFRDLIAPNRADSLKFWTSFEIHNVRMPFRSTEMTGVKRLLLTFKEPAPAHEDPLLGGSRVVATLHEDDGAYSWEETFEID